MPLASKTMPDPKPIMCCRSYQIIAICLSLITIALNPVPFALGVVAIGGWLACIVCVAVASMRADVAPTDLRFGKSVSIVATTLFALMLAAYTIWGIGLIVQARQAAHGNFTTIAYSHQDLWFPMVVLLSVAVMLSTFSSREARRSWRVLSVDIL